MDDYKEPVLKIWKRDKDGTYWAEYDDFCQAVLDSPKTTTQLAMQIGRERFRETMFGKGIYLFEVRSIEIALGAYKPLWQRAFEGRR